jgi:preprotein translocase subunit SecY
VIITLASSSIDANVTLLGRVLEREYYSSKSKKLPIKWTAPGTVHPIFVSSLMLLTEAIEFAKFSSKSDV